MCRCAVETTGARRGASVRAAIAANSAGPRPSSTSGSSSTKRGSIGTRRGNLPPGRGHPAGQHRRDLLVGAVLQQPGEQQVPGLEQGQVLLVVDLARGQQPGRLEVEQGRRDDQEVAGLIQVPAVGLGPDVADELVGDAGQRDLGDVQLVLGDQRRAAGRTGPRTRRGAPRTRSPPGASARLAVSSAPLRRHPLPAVYVRLRSASRPTAAGPPGSCRPRRPGRPAARPAPPGRSCPDPR